MTAQPVLYVYKILSAQDWSTASALGHSHTALDQGDGYVHLSTREQVGETLALHYKGQTGVYLLEYDASMFGEALRWEESRGGQLFPHLYGQLWIAKAHRHWTLTTGPDGIPALPDDIDA